MWRSAAVLRSGRQSFPYNQDSLGSTPRTREAVSLSPYRLRLRSILIDLTIISTVDFSALSLFLTLCSFAQQQGGCSTATITGGWWFSAPCFPHPPSILQFLTCRLPTDKGAAIMAACSVECSLLFPLWATWTHHSSMGRWARGPPHNSKGAAASAESERTCTYTLTVILIRGL